MTEDPNDQTFNVSVHDLAQKGYAVFHALPGFHPDKNSPIREYGLEYRPRIIAALEPELSVSTFMEGTPATGSAFGGSSVSLLSASGGVTGASSTDGGSVVDSKGKRIGIRAPESVEELDWALQKTVPNHHEVAGRNTGGYNELIVDDFKPAAVLVNFDNLLVKHIIDAGAEIEAGKKNSLLGHTQAALKGEKGGQTTFGSPIFSDHFWVNFAEKAMEDIDFAKSQAALTQDVSLPTYAVINGQLHRVGDATEAYSQAKVRSTAGSYGPKVSDILRKQEDVVQKISGVGKSIPERLTPLLQVDPTPTPLKEVMENGPRLSETTRASLALGVMPAFKPEYQHLPSMTFGRLTPDAQSRQSAIHGVKDSLLHDGNDIFFHARKYSVVGESFHNEAVFDKGQLNAEIHVAERWNAPTLELMSGEGAVRERIVPTEIRAIGIGDTAGTSTYGFRSAYQLAPSSETLFLKTKERLDKFGPDGVIYVDPADVVHAKEMHLRDPEYNWTSDPQKRLEDGISSQWERIQRKNPASQTKSLPPHRHRSNYAELIKAGQTPPHTQKAMAALQSHKEKTTPRPVAAEETPTTHAPSTTAKAGKFPAWAPAKLEKLNGKIGTAGMVVQTADAAMKGDMKKAAEVVGTGAALHYGMKGVAKVAGVRAVPVAGQIVGAGFAGLDTYASIKSGNTGRAVVSGIETTLYGVSAVSGAAAAFNFWNPVGWGAGAVAAVSGGAAVAISAGKGVYDNWGTVKGWFDKDHAPVSVQHKPVKNDLGPLGKPVFSNYRTLKAQEMNQRHTASAEVQSVPSLPQNRRFGFNGLNM